MRLQSPSSPATQSRRAWPTRLLGAAVLAAIAGVGGYMLLADRSATAPARTRLAPGAPNGMYLFTMNCAGCHHTGGDGLQGVFPPLAGSEWVTGDERVLANILLYGVEGELTVKGSAYKGSMPAFWRLSDGELAALATYARSSWSNRATPVTPDVIAAQRKQNPRTKPFAGGGELKAFAARLR